MSYNFLFYVQCYGNHRNQLININRRYMFCFLLLVNSDQLHIS